MYFPNEILLDKRKSLTIFGGEDRGRYVYQSDAFHRYNGAGETKFNSNVFFDELGTPASLEKYRNVKLSKDEVELYEFCKKVLSAIYYYDPRMNAPEKLDLVLLNFKKQLFVASLLEEDIVKDSIKHSKQKKEYLSNKKVKPLQVSLFKITSVCIGNSLV